MTTTAKTADEAAPRDGSLVEVRGQRWVVGAASTSGTAACATPPAQLAMEGRLVTQAGAGAAPRLTRIDAARALGADLARLEDTLAGRVQQIQDHHPERTGLTADQAAAVLSVLTDGKRVSVINAPAGSGKARVMTEAARLWAAAGRPVVGITPSQSARNTLAAGVPESYNTAQFLGHPPGQRGARGPPGISEGTLLLIDESSAIPTPDLADMINQTEARNGKAILAGDTGQLQAVENGGAMSLLADALGYVRLADPVRFPSQPARA